MSLSKVSSNNEMTTDKINDLTTDEIFRFMDLYLNRNMLLYNNL